jgi:AraC-like DNA-binding protein
MNQLRNKNATDCRFCSPTELIRTANSVIGNPKTINGRSNGNSPAVMPGLAMMLAKTAVGGNGNSETFPENGGSDGTRRIEQSIAYMREHLNQPLPVAKLAALANISPSHFFALFKRRTGSSPMDYFTHLRMHYACRLLDGTSTSVKEVAAAVGYDDPFYFSRVFKAVNRMPPSRYRALQEPPSPAFRPDKIGTAEGGRGGNGNGATSVSLPGNGKPTHEKSRIVHSIHEKTEL